MTLKSITLHRATTDNAGLFVDSGNDLVVGDEVKEGVIDADRARVLVDSHGAAGHHAKEMVAKPKATAKPKRTATAPEAPVAPAPPAPTPTADESTVKAD